MRTLWILLLVSGMSWAQAAESAQPASVQDANANAAAAPQTDPNAVMIPAGSKIPLSLKQAISTKNAREGDAVYAETAFPFVVNERVIVPAGTYIQGKITHVQRAGRVKGRAEILMHFTSMIYPSGYTVILPGSVPLPTTLTTPFPPMLISGSVRLSSPERIVRSERAATWLA